jgi:hypothetical protein
MKLCASFPVAPQGRGNGAFLFFAMLLHSKKSTTAESPLWMRKGAARDA